MYYPHFSCPLSDGEIFDFLGISVPGADLAHHWGGGGRGSLGSCVFADPRDWGVSPLLLPLGQKLGSWGDI